MEFSDHILYVGITPEQKYGKPQAISLAKTPNNSWIQVRCFTAEPLFSTVTIQFGFRTEHPFQTKIGCHFVLQNTNSRRYNSVVLYFIAKKMHLLASWCMFSCTHFMSRLWSHFIFGSLSKSRLHVILMVCIDHLSFPHEILNEFLN